MKTVIAIDSFKGCLSSAEANGAAAEGVRCVWPDAEVRQVAVSDGGEGFMEAFRAAIGGREVTAEVCDPLMRPVAAQYLLKDDTAVIEMAQASGLTLLAPGERNPLVASSYGTGQLVADAVRRGAQHVIVGLGGSATSDAGQGMLRALADGFAPRGDWEEARARLGHVRFTIATDVRNPLYGNQGAARVFAPQKIAPSRDKQDVEQMITELDERARAFAEASARRMGYDCSGMEGAGAAGGLGYAFLQYLGAERRSGIDLLLETVGFDEIIRDAALIITGEGRADRQTLMGKLPMGILRRAQRASTLQGSPTPLPVCLIAGQVCDREQLLQAGFAHVVCINPPGITTAEAMQRDTALRNIREAAYKLPTPFHLRHTSEYKIGSSE